MHALRALPGLHHRAGRSLPALALAGLALLLGAAPAAGQEPPPPAGPGQERTGWSPSPSSGDYRWQLMAGLGAAGTGAPNLLLGGGLALGAVAGTRIELNALLGYSTTRTGVPASPGWNRSGETYGDGTVSARSVLFELTGSRRTGTFELWAGGGVHLGTVQFRAPYTFTGCYDILCSRTYPGSDTFDDTGSLAVRPLLSAGARLLGSEHVLFGLDLRYLAPGTSRLPDFSVSSRVGGLSLSLGLTVRLGGAVPRGAVP